MTIASQVNDLIVPGTGSLAPVPLTFPFFSNADIQVARFSADGSITSLTEGVDYTLTGAGLPEVNGNAPGVLTPLTVTPVGQSLYVARIMAVEQPTDIRNQGRFYPDVHETVFDRITMLLQQINGVSERAIVVPRDEAPGISRTVPSIADRAGKFFVWNPDGSPGSAPFGDSSTINWSREPLIQSIATVHQMLDAQAVNLWEFADQVTVKPSSGNPATWDWTPAVQAWVNYLAANKQAGYAPAGTYLINQVTLPDSNLFIRGAGTFSTAFGPFSAGQTLFYKDQTTPVGVDNQTNQLRAFTDLAFIDEAGLGGCRAIYCQNVIGIVLQRVMWRKLDKAVEFNRCQNIVIDTFFTYKSGRFIFDASPYRKIAPSTYDYTKTVQITNGQDLLGYSDMGNNAWFSFRDTVNVLMANVQTPALMGKADGIRIIGSCEGIWLNNVIVVWPIKGIHMQAGLIDIGSGTPDTLVDPEYNNFVAVAVDQPVEEAFFMEGDYWNMESCIAANATARGTTGKGILITGRSRYFNIAKTLVRTNPGNGIEILNGAVDGTIRDCDVFDNATVSGAQINASLTKPNGVVFRDMRVVGTTSIAGSRLVGGNTSQVIHRDAGSSGTPASTTPTDLFTYTIPAGTLKIGQKVRLLAYGTFAANANNKTIRLWFGALNMGGWAATTNGGAWKIDAEVELLSAGSQEYVRNSSVQGAGASVGTAAGTENEALAVIAKVQGENGTASANDIVCQHFSVELLPL